MVVELAMQERQGGLQTPNWAWASPAKSERASRRGSKKRDFCIAKIY